MSTLQPAATQPNEIQTAPMVTHPAEPWTTSGILVISYPNERQETVELTKATVHIGRSSDNDIVLEDDLIADYHAQILCDASGCQVLDLGSHIGSQILDGISTDRRSLVGQRLPPKMPHPLLKGTTMLMGEIVLIYYPTYKDIPKAAGPTTDHWLVRPLHVISMLLLVVFLTGASALWAYNLWLSPALRAASIERPTSVPTALPPAVTPTPRRYIYEVVTDYRMNLHVRAAPGLDKPILGKIPYGTVIRVYSDPVPVAPYNWVQVEAPNLSGWCILEALHPQ
jgi:hypothetical protein